MSEQPADRASLLNRMRESTVLVTGASGFIGTHLCRTLEKAGVRVHATSRKPSHGITAVDLNDPKQVDGCFSDALKHFHAPIDYVFHLAGEKSAGVAYQEPVETLQSAVRSAQNLLETCRRSATIRAVKKVVLISSLAVYGQKERPEGSSGPFAESAPVFADSIYSATKLAGENLGLAYFHDYQVPVTIARLSNVYGPGQSPMAVIPSMIQQMIANPAGTITIGNRASVRDFVYVDDLIESLLRIAVAPAAAGTIVNIGTGTGTSIAELLEAVRRLTGFKGEIAVDKAKLRPDERLMLVTDTSRFASLTGWRPAIGLEDGLKRTVAALRA